jgi:hypothetical protein
VLHLARSLAASGRLHNLGLNFARELLLVVLDLIFSPQPADAPNSGDLSRGFGDGAAAGGAASAAAAVSRQQLLRELRELPLLPLAGGGWASAAGEPAGTGAHGAPRPQARQARVFLPLDVRSFAAAAAENTQAALAARGLHSGGGGGGSAAAATREALAASGLGEAFLLSPGGSVGGADGRGGGEGGGGDGGVATLLLRLLHGDFMGGAEDDVDKALLLRGLQVTLNPEPHL